MNCAKDAYLGALEEARHGRKRESLELLQLVIDWVKSENKLNEACSKFSTLLDYAKDESVSCIELADGLRELEEVFKVCEHCPLEMVETLSVINLSALVNNLNGLLNEKELPVEELYSVNLN